MIFFIFIHLPFSPLPFSFFVHTKCTTFSKKSPQKITIEIYYKIVKILWKSGIIGDGRCKPRREPLFRSRQWEQNRRVCALVLFRIKTVILGNEEWQSELLCLGSISHASATSKKCHRKNIFKRWGIGAGVSPPRYDGAGSVFSHPPPVHDAEREKFASPFSRHSHQHAENAK